jgi:hypothetical protein
MIVVAKEAPNNQIAVKSIVVHEATNDSNLSIVNKKEVAFQCNLERKPSNCKEGS